MPCPILDCQAGCSGDPTLPHTFLSNRSSTRWLVAAVHCSCWQGDKLRHYFLFNMASIPEPQVSGINEKADSPQQSWNENISGSGKTDAIIDTYRSYTPEFSKETEARLVKRIDRRILPLVVIIYLFNYLDRNSITQARLYGLQKDTHVKGAEYQTAISIFSAGYIAMQLPSTILMTKVRPSRLLVSS